MYTRYLKRVVDILLGIIAAILMLLPMVLLGILVKLSDPKGKIIFRQTRVGRNGKRFKILKFRTMRADTPRHLPNNRMTPQDYDDFVTPIGKWMRKTSMDELPQIFNIIKGDMSWVGPRPVIENETVLLKARKEAGLDTFRPGLTGWAQINGRNRLTDIEKAQFDAEYIQRISLIFDLVCMIRTVPLVISRKGFTEGCEQIDRIADFITGDEFILSDTTDYGTENTENT